MRQMVPQQHVAWVIEATIITKDVEGTNASECSGTVAGTLLLFMFTKKALIVVNFDVDISPFSVPL